MQGHLVQHKKDLTTFNYQLSTEECTVSALHIHNYAISLGHLHSVKWRKNKNFSSYFCTIVTDDFNIAAFTASNKSLKHQVYAIKALFGMHPKRVCPLNLNVRMTTKSSVI